MNVFRTRSRELFFRYRPLRLSIDQAEAARRIGNTDIVGDTQVRDQRQFLEDAGNACRRRFGG
ncbi:hypothetical protein D3C87_2159240 [compost metagenome]